MRKVETQLPQQLTYASASQITPISLPTEQLITEIKIDWSQAFNPTGTSTAWNSLAQARSTWNQFGIQGGPSYFVSLQEPILLLAENLLFHGTTVQDVCTVTTSVASLVREFQQIIHFGSFPFKHRNEKNNFDFTAGIIGPVFSKGGLLLTLTFPASTVPGTNVSITTSTVGYIEMSGILATNAELLAMRMAQPAFGETDIQMSAIGTQTGLAGRQDLPTGQYLRSLTFWQCDNSTPPASIDTTVTDLAIVYAYEGDRRAVESTWIPLRNESQSKMGNPLLQIGNNPTAGLANVGMACFDFRAHVSADPLAPDGPTYGMNLISQHAGNAQIAMTTAASTGQLKVLTEQFKPAMQAAAPTAAAGAGQVAGKAVPQLAAGD